MTPTSSRKRPAPGSLPVSSQQTQNLAYPSQLDMANDQFSRWPQNGDMAYVDPNGYNLGAFGANGTSGANAPFQQPVPASTQLTRRPGRQLVSTVPPPRAAYDSMTDPWGAFGDEQLIDGQNGGMEESENIELLEERAVVAKRDAQSKRKQIPPFVQKLSSFLDESKNTELIRWSDRGDSFVVLDEDEFAKTLIPELFKHNNYASFVRQLNMYGFHKRVGLSDNSMKASERKNKSPSEYYNPYFKRGHPNLLWLINKPKGGTSQKKGKVRTKTEEGEGESEDDVRDAVEEYTNYNQGAIQGAPRAISAVPESGPLQRREITQVQNQLQEIQKQQGAISSAISRLRKDHNQLYQQAVAFQTLHDRHESSINAILTFLATVYNRSLDGQGAANISQMFASAIPQEQQHQGNVVDIGDIRNNQQQPPPGSVSPLRRTQRLLMAPPAAGQPHQTQATAARLQHSPGAIRPGAIEELFDANTPTTDSPRIKTEFGQDPQQSMLNIINSTNAQVARPGGSPNRNAPLNFPDVLSHYENSNGHSPLTSEQRNDMLQLIAGNTGAGLSGANNALVSPTPPPGPSLAELGYTQAELDDLMRLQRDQNERIEGIASSLAPLSPSGSIPGLGDNQYFGGENGDGASTNSNLDLDQFLNTDTYYGNGDGTDYNNYNFDANPIGDSSTFDFSIGEGIDGGGDGGGVSGVGGNDSSTRIEAVGSSAGTSPEDGKHVQVEDEEDTMSSPSRKRRRA